VTPRSGRFVAGALLTLSVALVFLPVLLHPTQVLYSPRSDLLSFIHPYRALQNRAVAEHGRITLYDPTSFAGTPLVGDPQAALFYPPNWLHLLDRSGEGEAFHGWLVILHLLVGGWGTLWWLRGAGFPPAARLGAAFVLVYSGKWIHHVIVQGHLAFLPIVWVPWQCALIERVARRPDAGSVAALALVTALVPLGAQPQLVLYSQLFVVAWALFVAFRSGGEVARVPAFGAWVLAALLAFGLAAVSLLPAVADLALWVRGEGLGYAVAAERSLSPAQLLEWLWPGEPPRAHEPVPFVGCLALPLALFGLTSRSRRSLALFALAGVVAMAWYSLGEAGGLHRLLYLVLPGFDLFRIPPRVFLLLGPPLALAVAIGIESLGRGASSRSERSVALVLAALGLLGGLHVGVADGWPLVLGWTVPALVVFVTWPECTRVALPWALAALLFFDHARAVAPRIETRPLDVALGGNPVAERLAAPFGEGRVLAFNWRSGADLSALPATYTTRAGLESLRGFNPLIPRASWEYMQRGVAQREPETRIGVTIRTFPIESRPHLDLLNVRWVVTNAPLEIEGLELRETFDDVRVFHYQLPAEMTTLRTTFVYENVRRMPRAALVRSARGVADPGAALQAIGGLDPRREVLVEDAELVGHYPGEFRPVPVRHRGDALDMEVDAGEGGYLLVSELWYPGWKARVDGESAPVHRANAVFQLLRLPPGRHRVELEYAPTAYAWGRRITAVSLALALVCLAAGVLRRRTGGLRFSPSDAPSDRVG
jgi:hypothetical protein